MIQGYGDPNDFVLAFAPVFAPGDFDQTDRPPAADTRRRRTAAGVCAAGAVAFPCFVSVRGVRDTAWFFQRFSVGAAVLFDAPNAHFTAATLIDDPLAGTRVVHHDVLEDEPAVTDEMSIQDFAQEVVTKTRAGFPGRGMDVILRATEKQRRISDERKLAELRRLHPAPGVSGETPRLPVRYPVLNISADEFAHQAARLCRGRAPGASGWTEELVAAAARSDTNAAQLMANIVVDILNDESPEVNKELSMSRLVGIPKPEKIGVRPIGIGEPLFKIAAATALKKCGSEIDEFFGDKQFVLRDGGAEEIVHTIRKALREGKVVSALDSANAFNTIERSVIAQALLDLPAASPLYGVFNSTYNRTSRLRVFTKNGFTDILSQRGVRQGDPLGSVLYALGTFSVLTAAAARHPDCKIVAFADDIFIIAPNAASAARCRETIAQELFRRGVSLNREKTQTIGGDADSEADGLVVLGAWCGRAGSAEAFLNEKLRKYKTFFDASLRAYG
jgi:hypothetical protein